ncbi:MAG: PilW family protein [Rhodocyclaceae bacterium]|nr:PilW family protein [Rhodocyclaceae bacterium]
MRSVQLRARRMRGMTLVELMVGMTLGLFLVAGIGSVFVATGDAGRTTENLSRLQETARTAFSMMSRDIREAGLNDCGRVDKVMNVLGTAATPPPAWAAWNEGIRGFDAGQDAGNPVSGTGVGQRVATEDALQLMKGSSLGVSIVQTVVGAGATTPAALWVTDTSQFQPGDIAIACDATLATIFQITNTNPAGGNLQVVHNTGSSVSPGNCTKGLGFSANPRDCSTNGVSYSFKPNSRVLRFESIAWYVGNNGRAATGGTSLFRMRIGNTAGAAAPVGDELLEGVSGLEIDYLVDGATQYVDATTVTAANDWGDVIAVRIHLSLTSTALEANASGGAERMQREFFHVVTLRNRVS